MSYLYNMKKNIYTLLIIALLVQGCKSTEPTTDNRYKRQPIVEYTQEQLDIDAMLINAKTQELIGNRENAMKIYREIIAKQPNYDAAHYGLGRLLQQSGELDSALYYTQRATSLNDTNIWYLLQLTKIYETKKDGKNLTQTWERIVQQHPEKIEYYYELSNAYLMDFEVPAAIEVLNRVEKKIGVTEIISIQKQRLWEAIGKTDKAQRELENLASAMPHDQKYNAIIAEMYMKQKDYNKAKTYYDRILKNNPNDEYIHISLANYYKIVNDYDKAYLELKQGFLNPALDATSKLQILSSFYTPVQFYGEYSKEAFELLDIAMKQCTDSTTYGAFYGDVLMRQEKYKEALHQFKLHLAKDSSQYEVWEAMLICLTETGASNKEIIEQAQRAQKLFPLHILPYYLQGVAFLQSGEHKEAIAVLSQCEKIGFNKGYLQAETYAILGDCYHAIGDNETTFQYYDKCLALQPNNVSILNNYAYYLAQAEKNLERAEQMAKKAIELAPEEPTFLDTYAWVLHKMGRNKEALPFIKKAVALDKEHSETLKNHLETIASQQ